MRKKNIKNINNKTEEKKKKDMYLFVFERFFLLLFIFPLDEGSSPVVSGFLPPVCCGPSRFLVGTGILTNFPVTT